MKVQKNIRRCFQCGTLNHKLLMKVLCWSSEDGTLLILSPRQERPSLNYHYICHHRPCFQRIKKLKKLQRFFPKATADTLIHYHQSIDKVPFPEEGLI